MAEMSHALARLKREPFADLLIADQVNQLLKSTGYVWRDRLLPPLVVLRLFMIQILHRSGGFAFRNCAIAALRQLAQKDFAPSSYCEARQRLPLQVLQFLLQLLHKQVQRPMAAIKTIGHRI